MVYVARESSPSRINVIAVAALVSAVSMGVTSAVVTLLPGPSRGVQCFVLSPRVGTTQFTQA